MLAAFRDEVVVVFGEVEKEIQVFTGGPGVYAATRIWRFISAWWGLPGR